MSPFKISDFLFQFMQYNQLGKTDIKVSCLGFGCSPLGGVFGEIKEEEAITAVHKAIEVLQIVE
jgi:L-galactose dehydrogenase